MSERKRGAPKGVPRQKIYCVADVNPLPPDDQLLVGGTIKPLPPDHWCDGCGFATRLTDRIMCPFVEGSCVRLPGTVEEPNRELLGRRIRYDRAYTDAHREVFYGVDNSSSQMES